MTENHEESPLTNVRKQQIINRTDSEGRRNDYTSKEEKNEIGILISSMSGQD